MNMKESIKVLPYIDVINKLAIEEKSEGWLAWCEDNELFQYPVLEWIDTIAETIRNTGSKKNLEIASGNGIIGNAIKDSGLPIVLSDLTGKQDIENLDAKKALSKYNPDLVFTCWVPFDSEIDSLILNYPTVKWYLTVIQTGSGFLGNELIWNFPGWNFKEILSTIDFSVSRTDFLTKIDHGEHIVHGKTFLFTRELGLKK